jgi:hypothetical protein
MIFGENTWRTVACESFETKPEMKQRSTEGLRVEPKAVFGSPKQLLRVPEPPALGAHTMLWAPKAPPSGAQRATRDTSRFSCENILKLCSVFHCCSVMIITVPNVIHYHRRACCSRLTSIHCTCYRFQSSFICSFLITWIKVLKPLFLKSLKHPVETGFHAGRGGCLKNLPSS